eukprot:456117_1
MTFFNKKKGVQDSPQKKKKKRKKKGKKGQSKPKTTGGGNIKQLLKTINKKKLKPEINLSQHPNLISVFRGHSLDITGIAWHQSGKYLFSSSKDKCLSIWQNPKQSQSTYDSLLNIKAKDKGYFCALNTIIKPIHNTHDKHIDYDEKKDDSIHSFNEYNNLSNSIFACTNGVYALNSYIIKCTQKSIQLQMTSNIQTEFISTKPLEDIKCICISSELTFIALSGCRNTKIYFYDIKKKQRQTNNKKIKLNVAPQNKTELRVITEKIDKTLETIDGGQFINYEMNISMDGKWLSIGTFKKDIRLWRINYNKPGKRDTNQDMRFGGAELLCSIINAHNKSITCVTFSCNSKYMISVSKDGYIKVWDIIHCDYERGNKPKMIMEYNLGIGEIENIVMSYEYDVIAALNNEKKIIYIYQIKYDKKKVKLHCKFENLFCRSDGNGEINCIKFSPDSQYIAVGTNDFDVRVYKIPAHKKSSK